jgi:hypothetical protein
LANRFEGPSQDGRSMQLMEAGYRVSTGRSVFYIWQTIACVGNQKSNFPQFSIGPRGLWSRLGVSGHGIRFQTHPRFSARFKVKCADEAGARRFLVPLLLEEPSDFPTWWSKVAAVISSSFVREKSSSPPRCHGFKMRCARWRVFFPGEMQIP